jgi:hypothetical protein
MIASAALVGLSLTGCVETSASDGYNRNVLVQNQTRKTVYRFFGSNVSRSSYEEDILGNIVLRPGESVNINFDDGSGYCNFDFKVVFQDGSYFTDDNINVCSISSYSIR